MTTMSRRDPTFGLLRTSPDWSAAPALPPHWPRNQRWFQYLARRISWREGLIPTTSADRSSATSASVESPTKCGLKRRYLYLLVALKNYDYLLYPPYSGNSQLTSAYGRNIQVSKPYSENGHLTPPYDRNNEVTYSQLTPPYRETSPAPEASYYSPVYSQLYTIQQ